MTNRLFCSMALVDQLDDRLSYRLEAVLGTALNQYAYDELVHPGGLRYSCTLEEVLMKLYCSMLGEPVSIRRVDHTQPEVIMLYVLSHQGLTHVLSISELKRFLFLQPTFVVERARTGAATKRRRLECINEDALQGYDCDPAGASRHDRIIRHGGLIFAKLFAIASHAVNHYRAWEKTSVLDYDHHKNDGTDLLQELISKHPNERMQDLLSTATALQ